MDDKLLKLRTDRFEGKTPTYDEQLMLGVYKALNAEQTAGKYKQQSASKARAAAAQENKSLGIDSRKSSPVKANRGSSRGGGLSKKEREVTQMGVDLKEGRKPEE